MNYIKAHDNPNIEQAESFLDLENENLIEY